MNNDKLRWQILFETARLIYVGQETDTYRARMKAGRKVCGGWVKPEHLPTDVELRDEIRRLACRVVNEGRPADSGDTRLEALGDLPAERDRFDVYRTLLQPLEQVHQGRRRHPEGDALYHSLQVFDLACDQLPYDEEFQLAALLHDVGKAIDPRCHVAAGLAALEGFITERTAWLIEHQGEGARILDGTIGVRARRRLLESPDYDELLRLVRCDHAGRVPGAQPPDLDAALDRLRELARICG